MRYFDKTFFKFTLGFLAIVAISLLIIVATSAYAAEVSKVVFTTDPQTIKPNTLAGPITIQTQDSAGNLFQTLETIDIQFTSTSPTGEFLNSAGNPVTTYISKNTANKSFYYKDSSEGNFSITINIRGRESGIELSVSQTIIVSAGALSNNDPNISGEVLGTSTGSSSYSNQSFGGSTTNVSSLNSQLEVLSGNDRTIISGSPIWLQATLKKNTTGISPELSWSYGDGYVGIGPLVSHTYKYLGDYVVVLSARAGDIFSVSRFKVKVADSDIVVSDGGEYLGITNNGNTEINLFNWRIENKGKGFVFQPDTIILPKSSIKLDKSLLTMKGYDNSLGIGLKNSLGQEIFAIAPVEKADLSRVAKNLEIIKQEVLAIQSKIPKTEIRGIAVSPLSPSPENLSVTTTNTENIIYEAPKSEGFITKLTNFIKRVFSR